MDKEFFNNKKVNFERFEKDLAVKKLIEHFENYIYLRKKQRDWKFITHYIKFYALNINLLDTTYLDNYFNLILNIKKRKYSFVELKDGGCLITTTKDGIQKVQFSFATKLLHTLDGSKPIYDQKVSKFLKMGAPNTKDLDELNNYYNQFCEEFQKLVEDYQEELNSIRKKVIKNPAIGEGIKLFSDVKLLDSVIWWLQP